MAPKSFSSLYLSFDLGGGYRACAKKFNNRYSKAWYSLSIYNVHYLAFVEAENIAIYCLKYLISHILSLEFPIIRVALYRNTMYKVHKTLLRQNFYNSLNLFLHTNIIIRLKLKVLRNKIDVKTKVELN